MSAPAEERAGEAGLTGIELREAWPVLSTDERLEGLALLTHAETETLFLGMHAHDQAEMLLAAPPATRRSLMRFLPPDDAADVVQEAAAEERDGAAGAARRADPQGGGGAPRLRRGRGRRPDEPALRAAAPRHERRRGDQLPAPADARAACETVYYVYVLDAEQHLLGVVSFRDLFSAPPEKRVRDVMSTKVVTVPEDMDQEAVSKLFAEHNFLAMPVVDAEGRVKGIVTVDDIVDVVQEEATEDIQKLGGMEALDAPYLSIGFGAHDAEAGRLAVRPLPGRDAHRQRHGGLREGDRPRRGPGPLRARSSSAAAATRAPRRPRW